MSSTFVERIKQYMDSYEMLTPGGRVVVGLSGGADSVCLLLVLKKLGFDVEALHVNHMIRGEEADRDESFARELCDRERIRLTVVKRDIPALSKKLHMSEEETGRYIRYESLEELAGDAKIAVAHNENDLAETVIYNMIRGSSLQGIAGIRPVRGNIIRPLLMTKRSEIEAYLESEGQDFITDSTNLETDYSRNRIRLQVLPVLEELNDATVDHLAAVAMDALRLRDDMEKRLSEGLYEFADSKARIDIEYLRSLDTLVQGELVLRAMESVCGRRKDLTREHVSAVIGLSELESGKRISLPYGMIAERVYGEIRIRAEVLDEEKLEADTMDVGDALNAAHIETDEYPYTCDVDLSKKEYTKLIDCDKINFALCLRCPKPGDYIVINSDGGRKKLSRYFTEAKIERSERDSVPVVADGDEIVWIVGHRLSERYKVTPSTKKVTEIRYIKETEVKEIG